MRNSRRNTKELTTVRKLKYKIINPFVRPLIKLASPFKGKRVIYGEGVRLSEIKSTKKLISQLENKISDSESKLNDIDKSLCDPEVLKDSQKIKNLVNERKNLELEIQNLYSQWEEVNYRHL